MQKRIRKMAFACLVTALSFSLVSAAQTNLPAPPVSPAANPPRILICGDSLMKTLGIALERDLAKRGYNRNTLVTSIGTGLARLDLFNWHDLLRTRIAREQPEIAIISIGPNDNQPMKDASGANIPANTSEWTAEYLRRVTTCLDIMSVGGVKLVLWLGQPDMRNPDLQAHIDRVNQIFRDLVPDYPNTVYFDTQRILSREPGKFTMYLPDRDGMPVNVRVSDGSHLSMAGATMVARAVVDMIEKLRPLQAQGSGLKAH